MNKQNRKTAAIILAVLMIPALLFASGEAEDDESGYRGHGRRGRSGGRGHEFYGDDFFFGGEFLMKGMGAAFVSEVIAGSPAEAAGLQADDIILALNGERTFGLKSAIQELSPGDTVELTIARPRAEDDDMILPQELKLSITLGANDDGTAYAGIQYFGGHGDRGEMFKGGRFRDLDPQELEELQNLKDEMEEILNNSSL